MKTDITFILDRSGSMESIASATIEGFNKFLTEQKEVKGEANYTLVQFDDRYQVDYECISDPPYLSRDTFQPRGMTALYDALGKTIVSLGERLKNTVESQRPQGVIVVVITDGQENNSKEYRSDKIQQMIQHQESKYNWQFIFLAANQDAVLSGAQIGISANRAQTFDFSTKGVGSMYLGLSESVRAYRNTGDASKLNIGDEA